MSTEAATGAGGAETAAPLGQWPRLRAGAKTLFDDEWPPGFEDNGRRLALRVPEFSLFERWNGEMIFEYAPEVESALLKCLFRINDTEGNSSPEERGEIAKAFLSLLRSSQGDNEAEGFAPGCGAVGTRAARSIGALLEKHINAGFADDAVRILATCARAVFALEGGLPDARSKRAVPIEAELIYDLRLIALTRHARASKRELVNHLKSKGIDYPGKDSASKWRAAFDKTALSGLPDK